MSIDNFKDVLDFHVKFQQLTPAEVTHLTQRKLKERIDFMAEELTEFGHASVDQDMALMADALVDLVYVALGTAVMMGLPWRPLWDDVQRANMAKVLGKTHRRNLVDVAKPPGWQPPTTEVILADAGYQRGAFAAVNGLIDDDKCLDDLVHLERRDQP